MSVAFKKFTEETYADTWSSFSAFASYTPTSICNTASGKYVKAYILNQSVFISYSDTPIGPYSGDITITSGISNLFSTSPAIAMSLIDDALYMVIYYFDTGLYNCRADLWRDTTGEGVSFVKQSDIDLNLAPGFSAETSYSNPELTITPIIKLQNGMLVVSMPTLRPYYTVIQQNMYLFYSSDGGNTWARGGYHGGTYYENYFSGSITQLKDGSIVRGHLQAFLVWETATSAPTSYPILNYRGSGSGNIASYGAGLTRDTNGVLYALMWTDIHRFIGNEETYLTLKDFNNWEIVKANFGADTCRGVSDKKYVLFQSSGTAPGDTISFWINTTMSKKNNRVRNTRHFLEEFNRSKTIRHKQESGTYERVSL